MEDILMRAEFVTSMKYIDITELDRLGSNLYSAPEYLGFTEDTFSGEVYYLAVYDSNDQLLAVVPTYVIDEGTVSRNHNYYHTVILPVLGLSLDEYDGFPMLLAGSRYGFFNRLMIRSDSTSMDIEGLTTFCLWNLRDKCRDLGLKRIVFMWVPYEQTRLISNTIATTAMSFLGNYARIRVGNWNSFEDYMMSLSTNSRRTVRKEVQNFSNCGYTIEFGHLMEFDISELAVLASNVMRKYGYPGEVSALTRYISKQAEYFKTQSLVWLCKDGDVPVGFSMVIIRGSELYAIRHGVSLEQGRRGSVFFNLAYYLPIKYAIEHGLSMVNYGPGSYEAKIIRGAHVVPLYAIEVGSCLTVEHRRKLNAWSTERIDEWNERFAHRSGSLPNYPLNEWREYREE